MICHLHQFKAMLTVVMAIILMIHTCTRLEGLHQLISASVFRDNPFQQASYYSHDGNQGTSKQLRLRQRDGKQEYDYGEFWQQALNEALENNKILTGAGKWNQDDASTEVECPKVYIYNLSSQFNDVLPQEVSNRTFVFGRADKGWNGTLRQTVQHHLGLILEHRLRLPGNCYATDDPSKADLFFVPVLLRSKKAPQWVQTCQQLQQKSTMDALISELSFLNQSTACQHFFVFPKGHYSSEHCKSWFYDPLPIFNHSMRLAYSHVPGKAEDKDLIYFRQRSKNPEVDALHHPHLTSVPYPSNLHHKGTGRNPGSLVSSGTGTTAAATTESRSVSITMPWDEINHANRTVLMTFVGRFDHGDVPVRQQIQKQCQERYQDPTICSTPSTTGIQRKSSLPSQDILVKGKSIFCLEPAGDSPWRKSISDSIAFGCIPVLFHEMTDDVAPWHWGHWKKQGRVLVDRQAFVDGRIDLHALLSSIPAELQLLMQQTLSRFARTFQYSLDDDPGRDAVHTILEGLKNEMLHSKRQGLCPSLPGA